MPTAIDIRVKPLVRDIIGKFGKTAIYKQITGETYSPTTGKYTGGTTNSYTIKIAPPAEYHIKLINGDNILAGDMQTLIAATGLAFTPAIGDIITIDTVDWQVINVSPQYSGEDIVV